MPRPLKVHGNTTHQMKATLYQYHTPRAPASLPPPTPPPTPDFTLTRHARERYVQRFIEADRYSHLSACGNGCRRCQAANQALREDTRERGAVLDMAILQRLAQATEERAYLNNSEFMAYYLERYGYDCRIKYYRHQDALFVVRLSEDQRVVVTVLTMAQGIGQVFPQHVKYGRLRCG